MSMDVDLKWVVGGFLAGAVVLAGVILDLSVRVGSVGELEDRVTRIENVLTSEFESDFEGKAK